MIRFLFVSLEVHLSVSTGRFIKSDETSGEYFFGAVLLVLHPFFWVLIRVLPLGFSQRVLGSVALLCYVILHGVRREGLGCFPVLTPIRICSVDGIGVRVL